MRAWHLTWSSVGRHPLAPDEVSRRQIVGAIAKVAGGEVALFCVVDDHVHVVLWCDEKRRGTLSAGLTLAVRTLCKVEVEAPFVRTVRDRAHLEWLADVYILRQPWKHGLDAHPALWTGSCFADLAGARLIPGLELCIGSALPRWRHRRAYNAVFLPEVELIPVSEERIRAFGATRLASAAANAVGADVGLAGNAAAVVLARRATARLAKSAGIPNSEVAHSLGLHPVAAARLRNREVDEPVLRAVRMRLALEDAAAAHPPPPWTGEVREPEGPEYVPGGRGAT